MRTVKIGRAIVKRNYPLIELLCGTLISPINPQTFTEAKLFLQLPEWSECNTNKVTYHFES